MARRRRALGGLLVLVSVLASLPGVVAAADRTKVDQATRRVERGANQIGQGDLGPGFKEMFTGIGHTIVEGAKFSGNTIGEFFKRTFGGTETPRGRD